MKLLLAVALLSGCSAAGGDAAWTYAEGGAGGDADVSLAGAPATAGQPSAGGGEAGTGGSAPTAGAGGQPITGGAGMATAGGAGAPPTTAGMGGQAVAGSPAAGSAGQASTGGTPPAVEEPYACYPQGRDGPPSEGACAGHYYNPVVLTRDPQPSDDPCVLGYVYCFPFAHHPDYHANPPPLDCFWKRTVCGASPSP